MAPDGGGIELRLALAMRGGVSLSVWIGGACGEIDRLRQAPPGGFWRGLRELAGYNNVIVDVMAGASAGGLNAVIYTASQVYGFELEKLRGVWNSVGDLGPMVRDGKGDTPSLLKGDDYFLEKAWGELSELIAGPDTAETPEPRPSVRVDTTLSATLVEPIRTQAAGRVGIESQEQRFSSSFHFRHLDDTTSWLSDFVGPGRHKEVAWRLAVAARATAAYPVAFDAALVHSVRPASFAAPATQAKPGPAIDMFGVFGEATDQARPFAAMDGGVLDNIPLRRAIESIVQASAGGRTRRVLMYVRPGGAGDAPPADGPLPALAKVRSTAGVVRALIGSRIGSETITEDLRVLEEHNARIARALRLRRVRFGLIAEPDDPSKILRRRAEAKALTGNDVSRLSLAAADERDGYTVLRADADAQRTRRLLEDPLEVLGGDPFPVAPTGYLQDAWRAPLLQWRETDRTALDAALADAYAQKLRNSQVDEDLLLVGVGPIARLSIVLREVADEILSHGGPEERCTEAGLVKKELYRLQFVVRELFDRPQRLALVVLAATRKPQGPAASDGISPVGKWATDSLEALEAFFLLSDDQRMAVIAYVKEGTSPATLGPVRAAQFNLLDHIVAGELEQRAELRGPQDLLRRALVGRLESCHARLYNAGLEPYDGVPLFVTGPQRPRQCEYHLHIPLADAGPGRDALGALEIVTFSEFAVGEPGLPIIDFVEMSSTGRTPIAGVFPRLIEDIVPLGRGFDAAVARLVEAEPPSSIPVEAKLAGNVLANFGAFLKQEWRDNDWLWGQLDAVAPLVDVLVTQDTLVAAAGRFLDSPPSAEAMTSPTAALCLELKAIVVGQSGVARENGMATSTPAFMEGAVWVPRQARIEAAAAAAVSLAAKKQSDETVGSPTGSTVANIDDKDLAAVRDALIARRQWEIVAAWKKEDRALSPAEVVKWTEQYWVGLETLRNIEKADRRKTLRSVVRAGWGCVNSNLGRVPGESLVDKTAALVWWSSTASSRLFWGAVGLFFVLGTGMLIAGPSFDSTGGGTAKWASIAGGPGAVALLAGIVAIFLNRGVLATFGVLGGSALIVLSIRVGDALAAPLLVVGLGCLAFAVVLASLGVIRRKVR